MENKKARRISYDVPVTPRKLSNPCGNRPVSVLEDGYNPIDYRSVIAAIYMSLFPKAYTIRNIISDISSKGLSDTAMKADVSEADYWPDISYPTLHFESCQEDIAKAAGKLGLEQNQLMQLIGKSIFSSTFDLYKRELKCLGASLQEFINNVDYVKDEAWKMVKEDGGNIPVFLCWVQEEKKLVVAVEPRGMAYFFAGFFKAAAVEIFGADVSELVDDTLDDKALIIFEPSLGKGIQRLIKAEARYSLDPKDSKLTIKSFCRLFPFHFLFNRNMKVIQAGNAIQRLIGAGKLARGTVSDYFQIIRPVTGCSFEAIFQCTNRPFIIQIRKEDDVSPKQGMKLKGQILYVTEANALLFLGSPIVVKLDDLLGNGLFLSDIPIHDATRDVILIGEQTKAQDGLKHRMENLKENVQLASKQVELEKSKNVELLQMMFPTDIARQLWRGETVEPVKIDNVTMLFSDIVGFTSICSIATPMQVIDMLQSLYTRFDALCGTLDVYKVETIGDAYCCAGGLHRKCDNHAARVAWMSLRMMEEIASFSSPAGKTLKMRIGLHTGSVIAGVVGTRMPRYCLFGNNVTLANKFESCSVEGRINISPTTYSLLKPEGFKFTARARSDLPQGFPEDVEGTCYFLDSYDKNHSHIMNESSL
ncbi:guanylate cyclase soluble subunit alpha-1-like [Lineus longissimus]|uniref:guanylate cyclase soluble subunit alpha-1-like n=1 Tax=Lineus longissimus TaxID=88925 RepID=UPI00315D59A8